MLGKAALRHPAGGLPEQDSDVPVPGRGELGRDPVDVRRKNYITRDMYSYMSREPTGKLMGTAGVTEQGQGTDTIMAQVLADAVGVPMDDVRVLTGDTLVTPYGGGTWGTRAPQG